MPSIDRYELLSLLDSKFNGQEARDLTFDLGLDWDDLGGDTSTKRDHLAKVIDHYERLNRRDDLIAQVRKQRPDVLPADVGWVAAPPPPCPYMGMRPFGPEDAPFFYGRDAERQNILERLSSQRAVHIIGPSGAGKSSLIEAGVLPHLASSPLFPPGFWRVCSLRLASQPLQQLTNALGNNVLPSADLAPLLAAAPPAQRLLLVVNQFEDLFTQANHEEQARFIAALKTLQATDRCTLLVTLRADFFPALMNSELWPVPPSQRLELARLTGDPLRLAIRQPAADVGVEVASELVGRLVADAADEPGALPFVQETLRLLWGRMENRTLTLDAYRQLGEKSGSGLASAMARRADIAFDELTPAQQEIARRVLVALVQLNPAGPDTRCQKTVEDLQGPKDNPNDFAQALDHLTQRGLLVRTGQESEASGAVELAHEVLITGWPRLSGWLNEDRAGQLVHQRMERDANEWRKRGRDTSYLYIGARLADARRVADQHPRDVSTEDEEFLEASRRRHWIGVRARYIGQATGGAMGAAFGYALAFALLYLFVPSGEGAAGLDLLPVILMWFPLGALVGFCIGLGLYWQRDDRARRMVVSGLLGALSGGLSLFLIMLLVTLSLGPERLPGLLRNAAAGALLGGGLGIGAAWTDRRWPRLVAMLVGGTGGAPLSVLTGGFVDIDNLVLKVGLAVLSGAVLGALTGWGLYATAVDPNVHSEVPTTTHKETAS